MKAVFITYNLALSEKIEYMLNALEIRGYSQWPTMFGRGSEKGEPRMGSHTWPEFNAGIITIVEEEKVDILLQKIKNLDHVNLDVGVRAFVWDIEKMY
ncbi:MAG: PG0541 family transporter-associated protein [Bacteroidales bacterium]|jgi:hypothetical protein|nr:hypothetical protein [Bacteroidales bacterium]